LEFSGEVSQGNLSHQFDAERPTVEVVGFRFDLDFQHGERRSDEAIEITILDVLGVSLAMTATDSLGRLPSREDNIGEDRSGEDRISLALPCQRKTQNP